jgi:hypothetical protein
MLTIQFAYLQRDHFSLNCSSSDWQACSSRLRP